MKIKITKRLNGVLKEREYPANSNAARKEDWKKRGRVIHSGGTRIGHFNPEKYNETHP